MSADRRFVILDRDGTINVERHYLSDPEQIVLLRGAAEGLRELAEAGFGLVVVTNQSGVARGYLDEARLEEIHSRLRQLLAKADVHLAGIYACPHLAEADCACRKPRPGLVLAAARDLGFDPTRSFVIGDKPCDIDLGRAVGATTLLVRTGYGSHHEQLGEISPDHIVDDLTQAARVIQAISRTA